MGSVETLEWAAHPDRKYVYLQAYSPMEAVARYLNLYRETAQRKYGYEAASDRIGWSTPVYVAETDEQAVNEAREHIEALFNVFLPKQSELMFFPPGYMSPESLKRALAAKRGHRGGVKIENLIERGIMICGSPDTVRKRITACHNLMGFAELVCMLQFGTLPHHLTEKNIRLFASEVLPAVRQLGDDNYRGFELPKV